MSFSDGSKETTERATPDGIRSLASVKFTQSSAAETTAPLSAWDLDNK